MELQKELKQLEEHKNMMELQHKEKEANQIKHEMMMKERLSAAENLYLGKTSQGK